MTRALNVVADRLHPGVDLDTIPWVQVRCQHTASVRAALAAQYDYRTANKFLSALRQTLRHAWQLGQMDADAFLKAVAVKNLKVDKPAQAAARALTVGELLALVAQTQDGTVKGSRNAALLAVAYAGGLRRAEIAGLNLAHFDPGNGVLAVHGTRLQSQFCLWWAGSSRPVFKFSLSLPAADKADQVAPRGRGLAGAPRATSHVR